MDSSRHLAAIMFADIVGYTSMMQLDEDLARNTVNRFRNILEESVSADHGDVFQYYGDGSLCLFHTATEAARCALKIQKELQKDPRVPLRIGIHVGEILIEDKKVFGMGVNIASRIESLGKSGAILFSENVYEEIRNHSEFQSISLGEFEFKNVEKPMEVFALSNDGLPVPSIEEVRATQRKRPIAAYLGRPWRKWSLLVALGLLMVAFMLWFVNNQQNSGQSSGDMIANSIAVLPFDNYSVNEEHQFFADAIADEIRSQLYAIKDLKVISRSSSKHYKGLNLSSRQIGKELGVKFVLEGSVQRSFNSVKIGVELSNTQTDQLEWSQPFERNMEDVFLLENEIANQIVSKLSIRLSDQEQTDFDKVPTENAEAYEAFLKGQELLHRGEGKKEELDNAVDLFEEAIALDSNFDRAHIGLAATYLEYLFWGRFPPREALDIAYDAAFRSSKKETGEYYGILGAISYYRHDRKSSKNFLEKALKMSPNYLGAYIKLASIKTYEGQFDEALNLLSQAHSRDPRSLAYSGEKGLVYYYSREYEQGVETINDLMTDHPNNSFLKWVLGYLYTALGEHEKAISIFLSRSSGRTTNWMLGYAFGASGESEKAKEILDFQLERRKTQHVPAYMIATIYMGLGDHERALEWLERDYLEGGQGLFFWGLNRDIKFDPLKDDERFKKLLAVIK